MTARANKLTKRASMPDPASAQGPPSPANVVRVFVNGLERLGYDPESLLASAGLRRSDLADPDARISCTAIGGIFAAAMKQRPLKNLAARLAAETPMGAFPLLDYLVLTSETVGDGLKQLARFFRLTEAPYTLDPRESEDPPRVVYDSPQNAFAAEFGITLTILHLRNETEGKLRVDSVSLSHSPDDPAEIAQILGCPIKTNSSWNGFVLARESWKIPLRRRDPVLRGVLERHAAEIAARIPETESVAGDVRRVLAARLVKGDTQIQSVARALATSARSLQRRLASAGISYQQLLDLTRRDAAGEYLNDPALSVGEVAYLLGYSEPAAFHRAFKRWKGMTPQAFRDQQRGQGAPAELPAP